MTKKTTKGRNDQTAPSPRPSPASAGEGVPAAVRAYMAANGKKGGSATSEAKRAASAANGRKGGRPRKKKGAK